jgi:hypothetical protein
LQPTRDAFYHFLFGRQGSRRRWQPSARLLAGVTFMHIQAVTGDQLFRFSRAVFIIAVCVALNLVGVLISREVESILFLDLVGTAIASLIYGPIHGALVGFISNGIGEYLGFKYYFLFALVQAISAAAWGIIPRLSKGYFCTDFFNDGRDKAEIKYDYPRLFWGLIWVSFVSNVLASLTIAFLMSAYNQYLSCEAAVVIAREVPNFPGIILCDAARLLFSEPGYHLKHPFWEIAVAKAALGWPDHLVALSVAVLVVAYLLPGRRYMMTGMFGQTFVTQRRGLATAFAIIFVVLSLYRIWFAFGLGEGTGVVWDLFVLVAYTNVMLLVFIYSPYEFDAFQQNYTQHIFDGVNNDLERAYEDSLKLVTVLSVIIFWFIKSHCLTDECTTSSLFNRSGGDKITGFLGVVFVITFIRYLSLITARSNRVIKSGFARIERMFH